MKEEKLETAQNSTRIIHKYNSLKKSQTKEKLKITTSGVNSKCFVATLLF